MKRFALLGLATLVTVGCGKPTTPEGACAKVVGLSQHVVESACVSKLKWAQEKAPDRYAEAIKCIGEAKNEASAEDCVDALPRRPVRDKVREQADSVGGINGATK